jgi:hypothetical protein
VLKVFNHQNRQNCEMSDSIRSPDEDTVMSDSRRSQDDEDVMSDSRRDHDDVADQSDEPMCLSDVVAEALQTANGEAENTSSQPLPIFDTLAGYQEWYQTSLDTAKNALEATIAESARRLEANIAEHSRGPPDSEVQARHAQAGDLVSKARELAVQLSNESRNLPATLAIERQRLHQSMERQNLAHSLEMEKQALANSLEKEKQALAEFLTAERQRLAESLSIQRYEAAAAKYYRSPYEADNENVPIPDQDEIMSTINFEDIAPDSTQVTSEELIDVTTVDTNSQTDTGLRPSTSTGLNPPIEQLRQYRQADMSSYFNENRDQMVRNLIKNKGLNCAAVAVEAFDTMVNDYYNNPVVHPGEFSPTKHAEIATFVDGSSEGTIEHSLTVHMEGTTEGTSTTAEPQFPDVFDMVIPEPRVTTYGYHIRG